ncbi:MAG: hypothetical protein ACI8XO_000393 [Verrucomicrobiales bacterium]|jgi:hypothetical protein
MKSPILLLIALGTSVVAASAQTTVTIGGNGGDDTAEVPVSTWFRSDGPDGTGQTKEAFIGGIADTHDFIGVLSFDLTDLAGATSVSSVMVRLPQEGEIFDNRTGTLTSMAVTLTQLTIAPTNSATWNTYDGTNAWTTPGGTADTTGPAFTSNTFDLDLLVEDDAATATIVIPTSPELQALILANAGGRVDFLWQVPIAEGGASDVGRNFVVFDGAGVGSNGALDSSPQIEVTFEAPAVDPDLSIVTLPENFSLESEDAPATTTLTIRNDGANLNLSGTASIIGEGFSITSAMAIDLAPGATQDFTIQFDPSAATPNVNINSTVTLATNDANEPSVEVQLTGIATSGINLGSGGIDMATRGENLRDSGITAYGWIRDDAPDRVAGGETSFMGTSNGTTMLRGYVGFDLSSFASSDAISNATVSLWSQGATVFDANGGVVDIEETNLELRSLPEVAGFGDGFGGDATVGGFPANWTNLNSQYGATAIASATANLDTIAFGDEIRFDVTTAVQLAIAAGDQQITFGVVAPGAEAGGARNFFAMAGMNDHGATGGSEIGPNLSITRGSPDPIWIISVLRLPAGDEVDVVIRWNSRVGIDYAIDESTDLGSPWDEITDGVESQGEETTFRQTLTAPVPERYFIRVREL